MLAFVQGWRFELPTGTIATPHVYAKILRDGSAYCKVKEIVSAPGHVELRNKNNGKTYPKGSISGAEVFLENAALEVLCRAFQKGAKDTPSSWSMPFDSIL